MKYEFARIEKKWQETWDKKKVFAAVDDAAKTKFYGLIEFPYPSGEGLHVGHPRPYTAMDIVARKKRMLGFNVLFPIGFDAFGLPTENYAIKNKVHPAVVTKKNIARFTEQLKMLGYSFDWDRVVDTTDPEYYKWTQWIFLKLFENGLAYKASIPVNWCTSCKCVLANEEVVGGVCERCGADVVRREKSQWMLKITKIRPAPLGRPGPAGFHRARQDPAEKLDRPVHRRRGRLRNDLRRCEHRRGYAARFHDAAGHAVRRHVHGHLPGARIRRQMDAAL